MAGETAGVIVDVGVYEAGVRLAGTPSLAEAAGMAGTAGRFAWIGLAEPTELELDEIAKLWDVHPLAVEDAVHAHQRPKLDRYGNADLRRAQDRPVRRQ